jgi:hypothetical protein
VALIVAVVMVGAGAVVYYFLPSVRAQREADAGEPAAMETPKSAGETAAASGGQTAKYLEITGLRIIEENRRVQIRYVVVNHSAADLASMKGSLVLHASNAAEGAAPIATLPFEVTSLGPYEVKEITSPLKTNLRAYELPDWQFLRADLRLNSP